MSIKWIYLLQRLFLYMYWLLMQLIFVRFTSVCYEINVTISSFHPAPTNDLPVIQQVSEHHLSHLQVNKNTIA